MGLGNSFDKKLLKAVNKRHALMEQDEFSISDRQGELAIFVSEARPKPTQTLPLLQSTNLMIQEREHIHSFDQQIEFFHIEASRIKCEREAKHHYATIGRATKFMVDMALADKSISSIVVIGHGSVNGVDLEDKAEVKVYDWWDVSKASTHLKQGSFEQRTCAGFAREEGNIPMGTFALKTLSKVLIPDKPYIAENSPSDSQFFRIYSDQVGVFEQIRAMNTVNPHFYPNYRDIYKNLEPLH